MNFSKQLIDWYLEFHRELPFRDDRDPYKIWISEIMAQQTQIATMLPYYERWIIDYPDVTSLAAADLDDILKRWEGLGYYNRARNLHKGAQFVLEEFDGKLPADRKELMRIPGIGEYTSAAIASIAFGLDEVVIDGNVKRVMARYLNYTENVNARKAHHHFENFLKEELLTSKSDPNHFNQALMELGALVCKPSSPNCPLCPLKKKCAYANGLCTSEVPYILKKKKVPVYKKSVLIFIQDDQIMVSTDDSDGLMKGLYRLPMLDGHLKRKEDYRLKHKFSHLEWNIKAYRVDNISTNSNKWKMVTIKQLEDELAMVRAHRKILEDLKIIERLNYD